MIRTKEGITYRRFKVPPAIDFRLQHPPHFNRIGHRVDQLDPSNSKMNEVSEGGIIHHKEPTKLNLAVIFVHEILIYTF
jgi:hypothetical protein